MPDMDWTPVYNEFMRLIEENYTNEEWFCELPTEEKAKVLAIICLKERNNDGDSMSGWYEKHDEKYWKMWLKQPHQKE